MDTGPNGTDTIRIRKLQITILPAISQPPQPLHRMLSQTILRTARQIQTLGTTLAAFTAIWSHTINHASFKFGSVGWSNYKLAEGGDAELD